MLIGLALVAAAHRLLRSLVLDGAGRALLCARLEAGVDMTARVAVVVLRVTHF